MNVNRSGWSWFGRWKWVYEAAMVALAILVVVLLPLPSEGGIHTVNLVVWDVFAVDYFTRLLLSTDRKACFHRNIIDLLAIMPAGLRSSSVACVSCG